ncbi:MAG: hypothetical protein IPK85_00350 [Gemmatimonadetes bacterium]|nr:hypothetical protein [Gemmatimonadota bacterium]
MKRMYAALTVATAGTLAACFDDQPITPVEPIPAPTLSVVASTPMGGIDGFYFLAPIAEPPKAVPNDPTILDLLATEICECNGSACVGPLVRRFTSAITSPDRLQLVENALYRAEWNTQTDQLDPAKMYRIRVLGSGTELGYANVNILGAGEERDPSGVINLRAGATLPIRFKVQSGAAQRVGPGGGTVQLNSGVRLVVPAGAVAQDLLLTATPATNLPPGSLPLIPGTGWDFGPDGTVFSAPVTMTIPYNAATLPPGVVESDLRIHKLVNGAWQQQNAGQVDLVNKTVSAEVNGFSVYIVIPRNPVTPEDLTAPVVRALEVRDPVTGQYGSAVTLQASAADAPLTMRLKITDDIAGVLFIDVRLVSPSGKQVRFPCYTGAAPNTGSDTNGEWICTSLIPRYSENGAWSLATVWVRDRVQNFDIYGQQRGGLCNSNNCIAGAAQITVSSSPSDVTQPVLQSVVVSPDVTPRLYGPSLTIASTGNVQALRLGFQVTDDFSGLGGYQLFDGLGLEFLAPNGQVQPFQGLACTLTSGTNLNGFWDCLFTIPAQAQPGTWKLDRLRVPDRVGNGGWPGFADYRDNRQGQLCNPAGNCIANPTVIVTGTGDAAPPALQTVNIQPAGNIVTTNLGFTDNLSGVSFVRVVYNSTTTTQFQECITSLTGGTVTNGTWGCTINFSSLAARGQWILSLQAYDVAGNLRQYYRRPADGFLCYRDVGQNEVCQDFGATDLILQ